MEANGNDLKPSEDVSPIDLSINRTQVAATSNAPRSTNGNSKQSSPTAEDPELVDLKDQPSPAPDSEDTIEEPLTSHWHRLTTAQKNRCRKRIASWLGENYKVAFGVKLLVELVYQHYCIFCAKYTQRMPISQVVFERILTENYPNVTMKEEEVGRRPRKYFFYFVDLDILESSEEFETVRKGRKMSAAGSVSKRPGQKNADYHTSKRKKDKPGAQPPEPPGASEQNPDTEEPLSGKTEDQTEGATVSRVKWLSLAAEEKEAHREATAAWLQTEYEADSNVCMPRTAVFAHYLQYCSELATVPAPQAIFGRIIQKTFPRILMRRLGVRGESKYYYMGLDIRATSDHHADVSVGKVLSMGIKPKSNRLYLHTKT